jgi:DNA-directed RNA polymerase specialized sigma24 family protein
MSKTLPRVPSTIESSHKSDGTQVYSTAAPRDLRHIPGPVTISLRQWTTASCESRKGLTVVPGPNEEQGSVSRWLDELKAGDVEAVQPLWERYFSRLVRLARVKLRMKRRSSAADEEDAALSAFNSFCEGAAHGRFPKLADRDDLWRLLVVITARKAGAQAQRETRKKRGGGRVIGEVDLPAASLGRGMGVFEQVVGSEPSPDFAAMVAEEYTRLLDALGDDSLRQVALDRMEGYTSDEIAGRLGCARRTVARRLDLIREIWAEEVA